MQEYTTKVEFTTLNTHTLSHKTWQNYVFWKTHQTYAQPSETSLWVGLVSSWSIGWWSVDTTTMSQCHPQPINQCIMAFHAERASQELGYRSKTCLYAQFTPCKLLCTSVVNDHVHRLTAHLHTAKSALTCCPRVSCWCILHSSLTSAHIAPTLPDCCHLCRWPLCALLVFTLVASLFIKCHAHRNWW